MRELEAFGHKVSTYDPLAIPSEVLHEYGIELQTELPQGPFDAIVLAVRHDEIVAIGEKRMRELLVPGGLLYDLKEVLPVGSSDTRI